MVGLRATVGAVASQNQNRTKGLAMSLADELLRTTTRTAGGTTLSKDENEACHGMAYSMSLSVRDKLHEVAERGTNRYDGSLVPESGEEVGFFCIVSKHSAGYRRGITPAPIKRYEFTKERLVELLKGEGLSDVTIADERFDYAYSHQARGLFGTAKVVDEDMYDGIRAVLFVRW